MRVTRCNLKPIVKGSGRYHEIRWSVVFSLRLFVEAELRIALCAGASLWSLVGSD